MSMDSLDRRLILHVGLPKTATTTLQRALFACHPQIFYLGKIVEANQTEKKCLNEETYQVLRNVLWDIDVSLDVRHASGLFQNRILPSVAQGQSLVGSWEELAYVSTSRHLERLHRIKAVFGGCRIMYTLRNPLFQIPSLYIQNLRASFIKQENLWLTPRASVDIEEWYASWKRCRGEFAPLFNYSECIRASIELLGRENVGVFLFEDLLENPTRYYHSICEFVGIDSEIGTSLVERQHHHGRISQAQVDFVRGINSSWFKVFCSRKLRINTRRRAFMRRGGGPSAKVALTERLEKEISEVSSEGHRWLVNNCALPLEKYGYPLS